MSLTGAHIQAALKAAGAGSGLVMPADQIAAAFNDAMLTYGGGLFDTPAKVAALVSECMMESAYFRTTEEYAKNGSYAPYIGRTFMQLTWKTNYSKFGAWCKTLGLVTDADYFANNPARLADLQWAALGGVFYFTQVMFAKGPLTEYATDILAVGRAVNMGSPTSTHTPAGQPARAAAYRAVLALGSAIVPTPPNPEEPTVAHSDKWNCDFVWFRGGNVPLVVRDILLAIPSPVQLSQGGLNGSVAASANTHLGLGAYDVSVKGWSKTAISKLCSELISCGECAFPRGPRWGSPSFAEHVHVCSNNAYNSLHPDAQAQVRDFKAGRNGLVGHAGYVGPSTKLGKWADSPWNPVNIQKAKDAAEAAARKKELELPTTDQVAAALATDKNFLAAITKAVVNTDGAVPNTFTGNPLNKDVAVSTALEYLGSRSKKAEDALAAIKASLDALAAAVAAAFPEQPPAA